MKNEKPRRRNKRQETKNDNARALHAIRGARQTAKPTDRRMNRERERDM